MFCYIYLNKFIFDVPTIYTFKRPVRIKDHRYLKRNGGQDAFTA
jgi:hypothetical protein